MIDEEMALAMAQLMKEKDEEIRAAITKVSHDQHGIVSLMFSGRGTKMTVEILDEPYDDNVRVYPG